MDGQRGLRGIDDELRIAALSQTHGAQHGRAQGQVRARHLVGVVDGIAVAVGGLDQDGAAVVAHAGFFDLPVAVGVDHGFAKLVAILVIDLDGHARLDGTGRHRALDDEVGHCSCGRAALIVQDQRHSAGCPPPPPGRGQVFQQHDGLDFANQGRECRAQTFVDHIDGQVALGQDAGEAVLGEFDDRLVVVLLDDDVRLAGALEKDLQVLAGAFGPDMRRTSFGLRVEQFVMGACLGGDAQGVTLFASALDHLMRLEPGAIR